MHGELSPQVEAAVRDDVSVSKRDHIEVGELFT